MKRLKRILCSLFSLCLALLMTLPVSAKEEEYTYTIRFFSGRQGLFAGGEMMVFEGLHYGDRINFYQSAVILNDNSKYYIRGIRESGKDNSDSTQASSFVVTGDRDYVVAYGILGDATSYTINYIDEEGNALAPSETYYGNVGDRPVVAYLYIEGWTPEAYNITKTLEKDPSENIFNFVYTRVQEPAVPAPEPDEPDAPAVSPSPEQPGDTGNAGGTDDTGVTVIPAPQEPDDNVPEPDENPGVDEEDNPLPDDQDIPDDEVPTGGGPDELRDLDELDIPTSSFLALAADARLLGIPVPVIIVLGLGIIGIAWYFLIMRKKEKKEKEV